MRTMMMMGGVSLQSKINLSVMQPQFLNFYFLILTSFTLLLLFFSQVCRGLTNGKLNSPQGGMKTERRKAG